MKTITKETPWGTFVQSAPSSGVWANATTGLSHGWQQHSPGSNMFFFATYIDLAGLTLQEKTLFFQGAGQQDLYAPFATNQTAGDSMIVNDIMSSHPLSNDEILRTAIYGNFADSDNSGINGLTFTSTIYMRFRQFVVDLDTAAWGHMVTVADNQLGSLEPTASDRIYVYRTVLLTGTMTQAQIAPTRFLLRATAKEEPDFEYLMRLKRSYELQQSPDVD